MSPTSVLRGRKFLLYTEGMSDDDIEICAGLLRKHGGTRVFAIADATHVVVHPPTAETFKNWKDNLERFLKAQLQAAASLLRVPVLVRSEHITDWTRTGSEPEVDDAGNRPLWGPFDRLSPAGGDSRSHGTAQQYQTTTDEQGGSASSGPGDHDAPSAPTGTDPFGGALPFSVVEDPSWSSTDAGTADSSPNSAPPTTRDTKIKVISSSSKLDTSKPNVFSGPRSSFFVADGCGEGLAGIIVYLGGIIVNDLHIVDYIIVPGKKSSTMSLGGVAPAAHILRERFVMDCALHRKLRDPTRQLYIPNWARARTVVPRPNVPPVPSPSRPAVQRDSAAFYLARASIGVPLFGQPLARTPCAAAKASGNVSTEEKITPSKSLPRTGSSSLQLVTQEATTTTATSSTSTSAVTMAESSTPPSRVGAPPPTTFAAGTHPSNAIWVDDRSSVEDPSSVDDPTTEDAAPPTAPPSAKPPSTPQAKRGRISDPTDPTLG
ncbi:uncharacterized protein LOC62_07G009435 [Vanrija pseudolonga]|uniref:BRCT domain-containing protein n=1 Tax=Vanrija pseudolonga TaxID=143232 RepID=A0AAF1BLJ1_9TREE|nr:hypothetical protein LOC62_07G009435 [Vanrija pseudolonga]